MAQIVFGMSTTHLLVYTVLTAPGSPAQLQVAAHWVKVKEPSSLLQVPVLILFFPDPPGHCRKEHTKTHDFDSNKDREVERQRQRQRVGDTERQREKSDKSKRQERRENKRERENRETRETDGRASQQSCSTKQTCQHLSSASATG